MMDKAHTIRSENMTWEKGDRRFPVDGSTIFLLPGMPPPLRLAIVSQRTGKTGSYQLTNVERREGDVIRWNYTPVEGCPNARLTSGACIWNT